MSKMIQIRNVPESLHRTLKSRAAAEGLSLSDYIKRELERGVERRSLDEIRARISAREPGRFTTEETVAIIRELRGD